MGKESSIQWTDHSWNIAVGCKKVDEDCKFCYMYRESLDGKRFDPKVIRKTKTVFNLPDKIKEPSKIFLSSFTDWGLPEIDSFRHEMFAIVKRNQQHTYQALTKHPDRLPEILPPLAEWTEIHKIFTIGTSCGSDAAEYRCRDLISASLRVPMRTFLSLEPLHGPITFLNKFYFEGMGFERLKSNERTKIIELIDWVIIGGESGNENGKYRYRECKIEWIEALVDQCKSAGVPVFVKQLGTHLAKQLKLKDRHGGNIDEWPEHLRIREFPNAK